MCWLTRPKAFQHSTSLPAGNGFWNFIGCMERDSVPVTLVTPATEQRGISGSVSAPPQNFSRTSVGACSTCCFLPDWLPPSV